jgi:hypothetical protein
LAYQERGHYISKQYLLSHSRRFNKYLSENRLGDATTGFYNDVPEDSKTLEDVVVRKALGKEEFKLKLNACTNKLSDYKQRSQDIQESGTNDPMVSSLAGNMKLEEANLYC